jgi:cytoskeletal protein CcmA (bactofilin family)
MKKLILSLVVGALLVPALSFGAYWQAGESVSVTALQPVQDSAYLAGSILTVSGSVGGDLFAAGSSVSISGKVSGDIMAAGSMVNIVGAKAEDVRVAGSSVNLSGTVSGELLAAGAQVIIAADTQIAKDSHIAGSVLNFNGKSAGIVYLYGEKVTVGSGAVIKGDLNYSSPTEANIDPGAQISGKVNFTQTKAGSSQDKNALRAAFAGFFTVIFFVKLLAMLLAAYLLWYLRRKDSTEVIQQALSKFGASLLRGFIFMVVVPAGIIVLFFTVIGFPIGIFSALMYAALLMLACPFAILFTSSLILKKKIDLRWHHILLGAVVLALVNMVPVVGWIAAFIVYLASLGALLTVLRAKFKR